MAGYPQISNERAEMFQWLKRLLGVNTPTTHQRHGTVRTPQEPTGRAKVMRFQGKFSCGCPWPKDVLAPEECPNHSGTHRVYKLEQVLEMQNVEIMEVADGS